MRLFKKILTISRLSYKIHPSKIPYQERLRDRPYEAQQPPVMEEVLNPTKFFIKVLKDEVS